MKRTMTKRRFLIMLRHMGACARGIRHVEKFASPREAYERATALDVEWLTRNAAHKYHSDGYNQMRDEEALTDWRDISYFPRHNYYKKRLIAVFPWSRVEKMLFERAEADGVKL